MKKLVYGFVVSTLLLVSANAHEIWLKLDDKKSEAKLFFGHFEDDEKEGGEAFSRIKEGVVYPNDLVKEVKRNSDNITYTLTKKSDIVVVQEGEPRKGKDSEIVTKRVNYVKSGSTIKEPITTFDIVPVETSKNLFKLVYNNQPLVKQEVNVISPTGWEKSFSTNDKGEFTIHTPWIGTYLLQAKFEDNTKGEVDGKAFDKTVHAISYTIENSQGLTWKKNK